MPSKGVHPIAHLHGVRTRLVSQRAVIINQVSAFTLERGIAAVSYTHLTLPTTPYV